MVFELYEKGKSWISSLEPNVISINKSTISFGQDALKEFPDSSFVEVYLDRKENKVGFKFSKDSMRGFRLSETNKHSRKYCSGKFIGLLPTGQYEMEIEGDYVVINVSEIIDDTLTVKV